MKAIYQWVLKTMMKDQTGVMRTLPKKDLVDFNVAMTAERLARNGIDPNALKNANQVENAINQIEAPRNVQQGIRSTKSAKVMDMEGKEIDPRSKIMGGKQAQTEAEILARINKENKEAAQRIRDRKRLEDRAIEDFVDDAGGVNPDDPRGIDDFIPDPEDMAQGGRAGFFMGSANPKGLGLLRQILNYMSKKGTEQGRFQGANLTALDMLRLSNPKALNKMLQDVRGKVNIREGIMGTDTVRAQQQALRERRKGLTEKTLDVAKAMKADDDAFKIRLAKEAETTIIPQVKKQLMEGMGMSEEAAEKAARDMAEAAQNMRPLNVPPKITKEGILQLENVLKNMETGGKQARDLNAEGGRIGFKDGPKKSMTRRTFLKLLGGLASIPIIGKIVKPIKLASGVKKVPIIKTDNVPGKPEWFDQLVNKVIIEGDDVTKKFATAERQSIHQKTLDDGSVVRVTEDVDDGAVRVEYESYDNVFEDPVQLQYKKPLPDEGAPRPAAEFTTAESGPVGRAQGPDDFDIDIDEVGGTSIRDLDSDVSKLKEYATGKKPTMKELVQNIKRREKAAKITEGGDEMIDAVTRRQGDYVPEPDDFASGGIARMLGE